jgi:hypothetical protein
MGARAAGREGTATSIRSGTEAGSSTGESSCGNGWDEGEDKEKEATGDDDEKAFQ